MKNRKLYVWSVKSDLTVVLADSDEEAMRHLRDRGAGTLNLGPGLYFHGELPSITWVNEVATPQSWSTEN